MWPASSDVPSDASPDASKLQAVRSIENSGGPHQILQKARTSRQSSGRAIKVDFTYGQTSDGTLCALIFCKLCVPLTCGSLY